jgi:hypothetical protein
MRLFLAVLAVVLAVLPASAQVPDYAPDRAANWLTLAFGGCVGADLAVSMDAFAKGAATEANPLLRPLVDHPGWLGFTKTALNTAAVLGVYKWTRPHSRKRYIILGTLLAVQGAVVALNARQLRGNQ